MKENNW